MELYAIQHHDRVVAVCETEEEAIKTSAWYLVDSGTSLDAEVYISKFQTGVYPLTFEQEFSYSLRSGVVDNRLIEIELCEEEYCS